MSSDDDLKHTLSENTDEANSVKPFTNKPTEELLQPVMSQDEWVENDSREMVEAVNSLATDSEKLARIRRRSF